MSELEDAKRHGIRLGPGVYELGDSLHVDIVEVVVACHGDPASPRDVELAQQVIAETVGNLVPGIAIEVDDRRRRN